MLCSRKRKKNQFDIINGVEDENNNNNNKELQNFSRDRHVGVTHTIHKCIYNVRRTASSNAIKIDSEVI